MTIKEKITGLLMTDEISYLSHLKIIQLYGDSAVYSLAEDSDKWALAFYFPVELSSFDAASYPDAKYIVYAAANDKDLLRSILYELKLQLPAGCHLVFKTAKPMEKEIIGAQYSLTFKKSYLVFSADNPVEHECPDVVSTAAMDESLLPLWMENGYDRDTIEKYFNNGAVSFSIFSGDSLPGQPASDNILSGRIPSGSIPASTCLIFPATKNIWEIGAVHTAEPYRRHGYAKQVAAAAVNYIIGMGKRPDYMAENTNTASIHLAQNLGLRKILEIEHLYS